MEEILEELKRIKDKPVIVEGKKDMISLENLGFTNVHEISGALYKIIEQFEEEDEIVILTDLDKEGKKLFSVLYKGFAKRGVKVDTKIRELLFQTKLRQIEGLSNYLR